MRIITAFVCILFLMSACSENEAAIPLEKTDFAENTTMETNLKSEDEEIAIESEEYLEFVIEEEIVSISVADIPILYQYLLAQKNPDAAIQQMKLKKIDAGSEHFYILHFSCYQNHCSHLLLHPDKTKTAFLAADLARYESYFLSPDETKIVLQFSRTGEQHVPFGHVVVFDLMGWNPVSATSDQDVDMLGYKWPISTIEWTDDHSFVISFPDLIDTSKESWEAWSSSGQNSQVISNYHIKEN